MVQRGRKSAASLTLVSPGGNFRPEPPEYLPEDQKQEWRAVVDRLPADWFPRETHKLLEQYCRHVTRARALADVIDKYLLKKNMDPAVYTRLLQQEIAQSKAITALATKMRLSQQSSYDKSKKKNFTASPKPWAVEEDDE